MLDIYLGISRTKMADATRDVTENELYFAQLSST